MRTKTINHTYRLHKIKKRWVAILATTASVTAFFDLGGFTNQHVHADTLGGFTNQHVHADTINSSAAAANSSSATMMPSSNVASIKATSSFITSQASSVADSVTNNVNVATMKTKDVYTKVNQYYDQTDKHNQVNQKLLMVKQTVSNSKQKLAANSIINAKSVKVNAKATNFRTKHGMFTTKNDNVKPAYYTHGELAKLAHGTNFKHLLVVPTKQLDIYRHMSFKNGSTKIMRQNGFYIKGLAYYRQVPRFVLDGGGYLTANRKVSNVVNLADVEKKVVMSSQTTTTQAQSSALPSSSVATVSVSANSVYSSSVQNSNHSLVTNGFNMFIDNVATTGPSQDSFSSTSGNAIASTSFDAISSVNATINEPTSSSSANSIATSVTLASIDKARYLPGSLVNFTYTLSNTTNSETNDNVEVRIYKQNQLITTLGQSAAVSANASQTYQARWQAPNDDYTGYHADIAVDNQVQEVVAIDVSSDVNKFPRYGALTEFTPSDNNTQILNQMKDLDINNLEYYDAYQNPQSPMNLDNLTGTYTQDWAPWLSDVDKTKSGQVVKNTIDTAHQLNMDSMLYNMIYAITGNVNNPSYLQSIGVKPEWLLYHADGNNKDQLFQFHMAGYLPSSDPNYDKATQTYLDIENPEVVDWIVGRMKPILEQMDFDGWHGDTIGDNSLMYSKNADGTIKNEYHVSDALGNFANMVKQRLGSKKFVINTVSGGGEDNTATSNTDFDYSETWSGSYLDVVNEIKRVANESNKSLVIPGYLQEGLSKTNPGANFNPNAVLLFDAMVYGAGGSRMESVDGNHLLVGEFFPSKDLNVTPELQQQMQNYQTFITAYENLLRDGQRDNGNEVDVYNSNNQNVASNNASPNSVYAYGRSSNNSETVQLINMLGVSSDQWQDFNSSREQPTTLTNFHVKYRPSSQYQIGGSKQVHTVYVTSPDGNQASQSISVPFKWAHDSQGYYLDITVPQLQRWDMLYLK